MARAARPGQKATERQVAMARTAWLAASFALVAASAAQAQPEVLRWQVRQAEEGVVVAYEQPDTDFQPVYFMCRRAGRRLSVMLDQAHGVPPGRDTLVEFASEGGRFALRMRAEQSEPNEPIILRGGTAYDPAVARMLGEGRTLRVTVAGSTDRFPLVGARQGASLLGAACSG